MENRSLFKSKIGVVLAAAGAAVGLGNVWRFPTEVASNGGAAFILIYIGCVIFLGIPVMLSEFVIGRHSHANTIDAYKKLAPKTPWVVQGYIGWVVAWIVLFYYSVVAGWTLKYLVAACADQVMTQRDTAAYFTAFTSNTVEPLFYTIAILLLTHFIVSRGVEKGIEKYSKMLMPALFIMFIVLAIFSLFMPGATQGLKFLFYPDFSKLTPSVFLSAMGQAFFSLSVGIGCMVTYASYFDKNVSLTRTVGSVVSIDTFVAIISVIIIFPAVFSVAGSLPEAGPGLVFVTLPQIFSLNFVDVPVLGVFFTIAFYLLLVIAAITSTIAVHEVCSAFFLEHGWSRRKTTIFVTSVSIVMAIFCTWSFGPLQNFTIFGMTIFGFFDFLAAKLLMPIGGIIVCLFTGWYLDKNVVRAEITNKGKLFMPLFNIYIFILRYLAPLAIASIFLREMNIMN